jgi:hypothetical protein
MKHTLKKEKVSRYQTKKIRCLDKIVYPTITNKCKKYIPSHWKTNLDQFTSLKFNKVIKNIFNTIQSINYTINNIDAQISKKNDKNTNNNSQYFHSLLNSRFCSTDIINDVKDNHNCRIAVSFTFQLPNSSNVYKYSNLEIFCPYSSLKTITKSFINKIVSRILFLNFYLDTKTLPNRIHLYCSQKNKKFPKLNTRFTTQNVNSAVTDSIDIVIFRKEELLKSIIHELIHFHQIDSIMYPNQLIRELIDTHHISSRNPYYIRESVTEVLTTLFNSGFICYKQMNNLSIKPLLYYYKNTILNEMIHNTIQVAKIMRNISITSFEEFCKLKKRSEPHIQLQQDSDVFAYYILKMYLLNQLPKLISSCIQNNKIIVNKNHNLLVHKIFNQSRKDKELHNFINYLIKNGSKDKGMRMTAHILE